MEGRDKILKDALNSLRKHNYNGVLLIATGAGKTRIMVEAIKELKPKSILYLSDRRELRDKTFIHELHKWDASYLIPIIDMECYQTAYKWKDKKYDIVLADEFDAGLTDKYINVFNNNSFTYKILVSATLSEEKRYKARKIAPIIYEKNQKELIESKVLNKIKFIFIKYDLEGEENKKYLRYNDMFSNLLSSPQTNRTKKSLEMLKLERKHFLSGLKSSVKVTRWIVDNLSSKNEKVLIFCGLSTQADKVSPNSYHSTNNNIEALRKFEDGSIKELSVVGKITRGVNITDVKHIIHNTVSSSKIEMVQKIGRGLRLKQDETLNVFFIVPYYTHPKYGRKPTIIQN